MFVARNYVEYIHPQADSTIRDIYDNKPGNKIVVKGRTGKRKYRIDSLWGYMPKDGTGRRIHDQDIYKIVQVDTMCIYQRFVSSGKYRHHQYYYSLGLDGDINKLGIRELKKIAGSPIPFISVVKKEMKWYEDLDRYDKHAGSYKIVSLFKTWVERSCV